MAGERLAAAVLFGANLRRLRKRAGLAQEELAFRAGLHPTAIGQIERGERVPRMDTIVRLTGSLEVPVQELFFGITWQPARATPGSFEEAAPQDTDRSGR